MNQFLAATAILLFLAMIGGLVQILRGPTDADRMMAAQLLGTTGVAILLVLGHGLARPVLVDVALVFGLLAAVSAIAFVRFCNLADPGKGVGDERLDQ